MFVFAAYNESDYPSEEYGDPDTLQETFMTLNTGDSCRKIYSPISDSLEDLVLQLFVFSNNICGSGPDGSSDCYVSMLKPWNIKGIL